MNEQTTALAISQPSQIVAHQQRSKELLKLVGAEAAAKYVVSVQGKKYMQVAGLAMIGSALGLTSRTVSCSRIELPGGPWCWQAECAVVDEHGVERSRGTAFVADDESMWASRPQFARAAMAQTRAQGRALRQAMGWLVGLIGAGDIEQTPQEEMPDVIDRPAKPVKAVRVEPAAQPESAGDLIDVEVRKVVVKSGEKGGKVWTRTAALLKYPDGYEGWAATFDATLAGMVQAGEGQPARVLLTGDRAGMRCTITHFVGGRDEIPF